MPDRNNFGELLERVREGDQQAALLLVFDHGEVLRRYIRRELRLRGVHRAVSESDVLQSAFWAFLDAAERRAIYSRTDRELLQFIFRIAENKVRKHARHCHQACRDVRRVVPESVETIDPPDKKTERSAWEREVHDRLQAALDALPRLHRELVLARQNGATWEELAKDWGISPDAVRKKYERIMAKLRKELCGPETPGAEPPSRRRDGDGGGMAMAAGRSSPKGSLEPG